MSLIKIENFSYRYPIADEYALESINLEIEAGQLYALIGKNDSGKTTLCNAIRGFIPHFRGDYSGRITLEGKEIADYTLSELAPKIGYLFQNPFTQITGFKDTVYEEIAYGLENLGVARGEIIAKVNDVMDELEIAHLKDVNPFELSGGQKQKVALASTIVMEPDVYIFDEPTSQLDPHATEEVFEVIDQLKKAGKTIILVEHKIDLIAEYADQVVLINEGSVQMAGNVRDVLTHEAVIQSGVALPKYAVLGHEMRRRGIPVDSIPITEDEASQLLSRYMKGRV